MKFRLVALLLLGVLCSVSQNPMAAGGRWVRIQKTDPKTGAEFVTFAVEANSNLYDRHPAVSITCSDRLKPPDVRFFADTILDTQIHDPMNYYAAALYASIKIDNNRIYRAVWDIQAGESPRLTKTAIVDRRTTRELLKGSLLKIRFEGHLGQELIDTFTIGGLDKEMVRDACGSRWFGKE